jgi:hypothetical protein
LERINVDGTSIDSENWGTSQFVLGATPGFINSLTQKEFDVSVTKINSDPKFPLMGDTVNIMAIVHNPGENSSAFALNLFEDTDLDSLSDQLLESSLTINLNSGDSIEYNFNYTIENLTTVIGFEVNADYPIDENTTNNSFYKIVRPGYPPSSIVINEIMYRPQNDEPEWVEFYNNTSEEINLMNWSLSDVLTNPVTKVISEVDLIVPGKSFFVITKDTSIINFHRVVPSQTIVVNFANLNNDEDGVVLRDDRGVTIDSVLYKSTWPAKNGFSIERKSLTAPSNQIGNWDVSVDLEQSTPGRINSVTAKEHDLAIQSISFSPRFPLAGENVSINVKLKNNASQNADNFTVQFFTGNVIPNLLLSEITSQSLSAHDSLIISSTNTFELISETIAAVKIIYTDDEDTLNNYAENIIIPGFEQNIILINEVMFNPFSGETEWIEFVNVSIDKINLINWSVSDLLSSPTKNIITYDSLIIASGEYFIIATNSSLINSVQNTHVFEVDFGSLSNSEDGVILYDFRDAIIDSLNYQSDWGGGKGFSLERISFEDLTNTKFNWATSLNPSGGTPGIVNSVSQLPLNNSKDIVINEIMYDPDPNNTEFVEFINTSDRFIEIGGWRIEDEAGNYYKLSNLSLEIPPNQYFILAADSSILLHYDWLDQFQFKSIVDESTLGLSNSGELIILKDLRGNIIDSVYYSPKWNNKNLGITKNKSLEKITPYLISTSEFNWSSSVDNLGATPGKENSIFTSNLSKEAKITISPNPFSPDNDGFEDFAIINYQLTQAIAQIRIKVYDSKGRKVRTIENNKSSGSQGSIIFDGLDDSGRPLKIGIYILYIEALNSSSGVVDTMKEAIVVARKL